MGCNFYTDWRSCLECPYPDCTLGEKAETDEIMGRIGKTIEECIGIIGELTVKRNASSDSLAREGYTRRITAVRRKIKMWPGVTQEQLARAGILKPAPLDEAREKVLEWQKRCETADTGERRTKAKIGLRKWTERLRVLESEAVE